MTEITANWLRAQLACDAGVDSFVARLGEGGSVDALEHLRYLADHNPPWGIWVGVRLPEFAAVRARWMLYLLSDPHHGVRRHTSEGSEARAAVDRVARLWERERRGDSPTHAQWAAARAEARAAAGAAKAAEEWAAEEWAPGAKTEARAALLAEMIRLLEGAS